MAKFKLMDSGAQAASIKIIGVGGGGGNAVKHMVKSGISSVDFICTNTDAQALSNVDGIKSLQIGANITKGLGAGATPEIGQQAALDDRELIQESIVDTDMLFITAGMGGGTGTGAAPVVAEIAREMGILVVGVVTKPFSFEGKARMDVAMAGITELTKHVDSLITIPNDKLLDVLGHDFDLMNAFDSANDVLANAVQGITELITCPGIINVDFADVQGVMKKVGMGMMGSGRAIGEGRATKAAQAAISSPLLEDVDIQGAQGILVNVTSAKMSLGEFKDIGEVIRSFASDNARTIVGMAVDESLDDEIRVTVVATGIGGAVQTAPIVKEPKSLEIKVVGKAEKAERPKYSNFDEPPATRRIRANAKKDDVPTGAGYNEELEDILDIPAFLRKQAD